MSRNEWHVRTVHDDIQHAVAHDGGEEDAGRGDLAECCARADSRAQRLAALSFFVSRLMTSVTVNG